MTISNEQQNQRLKLYSENKTDAEIATVVGTRKAAIWAWRRKYNLPSNKTRHKLERDRMLFKLYSEGYADKEIAKRVGQREPSIIYYWRKKNGLQSNNQRKSAERTGKVIELHAKGKSDTEIGKELGLPRKKVCQIRQSKKLQCNSKGLRAIIGETEERVKSLYEQGLSDGKIAEAVGINKTTVGNWRKRNGVKPNYRPCQKLKKEYIVSRTLRECRL